MLIQGATSATAQEALRVYVPNQMGASVSVLDGSGALIETVDLRPLGFSAHAMPHQVTSAPDGSAWYVTLAGDGFVVKFDRENRFTSPTSSFRVRTRSRWTRQRTADGCSPAASRRTRLRLSTSPPATFR
jgi:hypothetical protein